MNTRDQAAAVAAWWDYMRPNHPGEHVIEQARQDGSLDELIAELVSITANFHPNYAVGAIFALGSITEAKRPEVWNAFIAVLPNGAPRHALDETYAEQDDMRSPGMAAAQVLARWNVREAIPALTQTAVNKNLAVEVRVAALEALKDMRAVEALPAIHGITEDRSSTTTGVYTMERLEVAKRAADVAAFLTGSVN